MISPVQLLALEAHARAHNGGMGDSRLLALVRQARVGGAAEYRAHRALEDRIALMSSTGERISVLVTDNAATTIPADEIEALASAAWDGGHGSDPLVRLLRRLNPGDPVVGHLDARARANGYAQAGSDERIPDDTTPAGDR